MLSQKNDFLLLDATLNHASDPSPENWAALMASMKKSHPLKTSFYASNLLQSGERMPMSPLELSILFGSIESVTGFIRAAKVHPDFKNIEDCVLANLMNCWEKGTEYRSQNYVYGQGRMSSDFYDRHYGAPCHLGTVEFCLLSKKWCYEQNEQTVDSFWKELTSVCNIKNEHKDYIFNMFRNNLDERDLRSRGVFVSGLLKRLPSGWFKEKSGFLKETQKILDLARRISENHDNNTEKCRVFAACLDKKVLTSSLASQKIPAGVRETAHGKRM